jgi:hypothetical protein
MPKEIKLLVLFANNRIKVHVVNIQLVASERLLCFIKLCYALLGSYRMKLAFCNNQTQELDRQDACKIVTKLWQVRQYD